MATESPQSGPAAARPATSVDRWASIGDRWRHGPYGIHCGTHALSIQRPAVHRDLWTLLTEIIESGKLSFSAAIVAAGLIASGLFVVVIAQYAFWAKWERLAWTWDRTERVQLRLDGKPERPPKLWHMVVAAVTAVLWTIPYLAVWLLWMVLLGKTGVLSFLASFGD